MPHTALARPATAPGSRRPGARSRALSVSGRRRLLPARWALFLGIVRGSLAQGGGAPECPCVRADSPHMAGIPAALAILQYAEGYGGSCKAHDDGLASESCDGLTGV